MGELRDQDPSPSPWGDTGSIPPEWTTMKFTTDSRQTAALRFIATYADDNGVAGFLGRLAQEALEQ